MRAPPALQPFQTHLVVEKDSSRSRQLRRRLVEQLVDTRAIRSAGWRAAFERVPRHLFVPRFELRVASGWAMIDGSRPEQRRRWLAEVYRDQPLITQRGPGDQALPTSTSSTPSVMAVMLEALDAEPGHRVLEIGTGTGYNAALLCERLGSEHVTSIDIEEALVEAARDRLRTAGYRPRLWVGDGFEGWAEDAPYDRIIATCTADRIPPAWVAQLRTGGVIVAPLPGGVVRLERNRDGLVSGRFLPEALGFMDMRGHAPPRPPVAELMELVGRPAPERTARYDYDTLFQAGGERWPFWFLVRLLVAPFEVLFPAGPDAGGYVDLADRSWVRLGLADRRVRQGGPRRLWDLVEDLYERWLTLGSPGRERFGLTVTLAGEHTLWLDQPDSEHRWAVPSTLLGREADAPGPRA